MRRQPVDPGLRIRPAGPQDDDVLGELLVESFVTTYARKMPEVVVHDRRKADLRDTRRRRESVAVLVAELAGKVAGTITVNPVGYEGTRAWLPNAVEIRLMAVAPQAQGKGVAAALLEAAHQLARDAGASVSCLHVRRGAVGVARFYVNQGYQRDPSGDVDLLPEIYLEGHTFRLK